MTTSRLYIQLDNLQNINASDAMMDGAEVVLQAARINVAVDTGALKDSLMDGILPVEERGAFVRAGGGINDVNYASFVEFGNSNPNYPIQPYMRPAVDDNLTRIAQAVGNNINKQLAELARR